MASKIATYLSQILSAVYGKDVRQSIHDAISQCYADVNNPTLINGALVNAVQDKIDDGTIASLMVEDGSITEEKLADDVVALINSGTYVFGDDGAMYSLFVTEEGTIGIKKATGLFPGKKILSNIDFSEAYLPDGLSVYCVTDHATKEVLYASSGNARNQISPFRNYLASGSTSFTASKAYKKAIAASGAFGVVFDNAGAAANNSGWDTYQIATGMTMSIYNVYDTTGGGWQNLRVTCSSVPYIKADGTQGTYTGGTVGSAVTGVRLADVHTDWARSIVAYSFEADGHINVIYNGTLVYTYEAPEDFGAWDFTANMSSGWAVSTMNVAGNYAKAHFLLMNNSVTVADVLNYHDYLNGQMEATGISALDGLYTQVGDTCNLYYQILPTTYEATASVKSSNSSIVRCDDDGTITCIAAGSATINITCDNITVQIPVIVGQEMSSIAQTDVMALATKSSDTIVIVNEEDLPNTMYVGDEFAVYALAINTQEAVPYSVSDQNMVDFQSSDPTVCAVEFGVLHANKAGTATITISTLLEDASKTFTVTVEDTPSYVIPECSVYSCDDHQFEIYNNGSNAAKTTAGIQAALNYAVQMGYTCIRFNQGNYLLDPTSCPIVVPANLILDFNGSTIRPVKDNAKIMAKTGYSFFSIKDVSDSGIINAHFCGDNYYTKADTYKVFGAGAISVTGEAHNTLIKDCDFEYFAGRHISLSYNIYKESTGGETRCGFQLSNVEAGDINDDGTVGATSVSGHFRSADYINISRLNDNFGLGNMVGYQGYLYMSSRLYNIYFYDSDKQFISMKRWCVQYQTYTKPENAVYCKIMFFQTSAPTSKDGDFNSIAEVYSARNPRNVKIINCTFDNAVYLAISPQGGKNLLIENCVFTNNGRIDPASAIDWEDGRIHIQGHIVRDCKFYSGNGQFTMINGRDFVIHDNFLDGVAFYNGSESQHSRIYRNVFLNETAAKFSIASKNDMVFAQNLYNVEPTHSSTPAGGSLIFVDNTLLSS